MGFHIGRLPFWPSSILVVYHFGRLPFWSSSILVVFIFGRLHFWSSSFFGRLPFWVRSSSFLVWLFSCLKLVLWVLKNLGRTDGRTHAQKSHLWRRAPHCLKKYREFSENMKI